MSRLAEVLQAIVALAVVAGDIFLNVHGGSTAAYDSFAAIVVGFYFGGKVAQTVIQTQGNGSSTPQVVQVPAALPAGVSDTAAGAGSADPPADGPAA